MKILAYSDRTPSTRILETIISTQPDLICTLGDLYHPDIAELEKVTDIPKIGVYGNHCSGTYMELLGIINLHLKTWEFQGLTFGGFQGCVRYKENPEAIMYTQEQASSLMQSFPYVDVMITHAPPFGVNDEPDDVSHQGFQALRSYLDNKKPRLWLHGHTYPQPPLAAYGSTRIEYVFREKVIEL